MFEVECILIQGCDLFPGTKLFSSVPVFTPINHWFVLVPVFVFVLEKTFLFRSFPFFGSNNPLEKWTNFKFYFCWFFFFRLSFWCSDSRMFLKNRNGDDHSPNFNQCFVTYLFICFAKMLRFFFYLTFPSQNDHYIFIELICYS